MNARTVGAWAVFGLALALSGALLLNACTSGARVGALQTESQVVELDSAGPVRADITMGAGDLKVAGGAEKLLEADFAYNVAKLKPQVEYRDGTLVVNEPEANGAPDIRGVGGFHNEWDLHLNDTVPLDLHVAMGAGTGDLQLAGLSLTGLAANLGAGTYTIDLSGDWAHDVKASINAGAGTVNLRLPRDVGARVKVQAGPHAITAGDLKQEGDVYTNAAYGVSDVTLEVDLEFGLGQVNLEVDQAAAEAD
jgi:hypothetical protein